VVGTSGVGRNRVNKGSRLLSIQVRASCMFVFEVTIKIRPSVLVVSMLWHQGVSMKISCSVMRRLGLVGSAIEMSISK